MVWFQHANKFTAFFKRHVGYTPTEYLRLRHETESMNFDQADLQARRDVVYVDGRQSG